jgi:hypothetical protein
MLPIDGREILSFTCFWTTESQLSTAITDVVSGSFGRPYTIERLPAVSTPLPQYYNPKRHEVCLWSPPCDAAGTVFFPNLQDGWSSLVHCILTDFPFRAVSVRISPLSVRYPICEFHYHAGRGVRRIVRSMRDSPSWQFFTDGPVQPFEQAESYRARLIKKRFTADMLCGYMSTLGWPITSPAFWIPPHATITRIVA